MTDPGYLWRWEVGKRFFSHGSSPYPWMEKGLTRKPVYYTYIEIMISVFTLVER